MVDLPPAPPSALLLLAAAELEQRADYGAFRDRLQAERATWDGIRAVAGWLRQQAAALQAKEG
ncbi:hypothetical protein [Pseudoroseomonas ludipueritiae]|uniref:Uncharacterized protein n=1 Tax=Pseudoroseomonas ludipueritiae TaxID=198093 RepID=A0ABR7R817_9PROT|nr:hypothetical protein [Pseudoroseomonas ludipueritiae]MBC9177823.1 hypothetical protein [Pseudoroseomonas ludipueritiae]MCG7363167.1 hypothetical protein [Roseomonas sp. ACRSG]